MSIKRKYPMMKREQVLVNELIFFMHYRWSKKKIKLYKLRGLKANPQVDATATDFATSLLQFNF